MKQLMFVAALLAGVSPALAQLDYDANGQPMTNGVYNYNQNWTPPPQPDWQKPPYGSYNNPYQGPYYNGRGLNDGF